MAEPPKESIKGNSLEGAKQDQDSLLRQLKEIKDPYVWPIKGVHIIVNPGVFPPLATDTGLLIEHMDAKEGQRVLDLTTGTGVFAVFAGRKGATGVAVDLNPTAVDNAGLNFRYYHVDFQAIQSDLFENVPPEQFDQIFVNGPYTEGEVTDPLQLAFYGARDYLTRFFSQAPRYLKPDGRILITFAEWGDLDFFERTASENGFVFKLLDKRDSPRGQRTYRLYEMRRESAGTSRS